MRIITLFALFLFIGLSLPSNLYSQDCDDPDNNNITSPCGSTFALCVDRYFLSENEDFVIMDIIANDISGLVDIDLCQSYISIQPKYGVAGRVTEFPGLASENLDDCLFAYKADQAYGVLKDTFEYTLLIKDKCGDFTSGYCDSGNGKIWTIWSEYLSNNTAASIEVFNSKELKNGGSNQPFVTINGPINNGDHFFADGTDLPNNQTEWTYRIHFSDNNLNPVDVEIHTSCSVEIFGVSYPESGTSYIKPLGGCVGPDNNNFHPESDCATFSGSNSLRNNNISTREEIGYVFEDQAEVIISRPQSNVLPLRLSEFSAIEKSDANLIQWTVASSKDEFEMILEKSNDGINYYPKKSFLNIALQTYTFYDKDIAHKDHYYRIKSVSINGAITYSGVKYIERQVESTITIHPNPTKGFIELGVISNQLDKISRINIFDMAGRRLYSQNIGQTSKQLDLKSMGLSSGVYFVEANSENGLRMIERIIIQ